MQRRLNKRSFEKMAGMNPFGGMGGGSKEPGTGAASTKKTVKTSKLARMTEEEKVLLFIMNENRNMVE